MRCQSKKRMSGRKTSSAYAMIHLSVLIFEKSTIVRQAANFLLSHGPESRRFGKIPSGANIPSCPRVMEGTRSNSPSRRRSMQGAQQPTFERTWLDWLVAKLQSQPIQSMLSLYKQPINPRLLVDCGWLPSNGMVDNSCLDVCD
jgi:hypothetical protein